MIWVPMRDRDRRPGTKSLHEAELFPGIMVSHFADGTSLHGNLWIHVLRTGELIGLAQWATRRTKRTLYFHVLPHLL